TIGGLVSFIRDAIMTPSHASYSKYGYVSCVKILPAVGGPVFQPATPTADLLLLNASNKAFGTALYTQSSLSRQTRSQPFHFSATHFSSYQQCTPEIIMCVDVQ